MAAKLTELGCEHGVPSDKKNKRNYQYEGRKNSPRSTHIERLKAEATSIKLLRDNAANQEARNNEEYINTDKASLDLIRKGVEQHHSDDR